MDVFVQILDNISICQSAGKNIFFVTVQFCLRMLKFVLKSKPPISDIDFDNNEWCIFTKHSAPLG